MQPCGKLGLEHIYENYKNYRNGRDGSYIFSSGNFLGSRLFRRGLHGLQT